MDHCIQYKSKKKIIIKKFSCSAFNYSSMYNLIYCMYTLVGLKTTTTTKTTIDTENFQTNAC